MRLILPLLLCLSALAASLIQPKKQARRLEVLFLGAPTAAHPGHDPVTRYRVIKRNLGSEGINFTYSENPSEVFQSDTLRRFDAVMMYGNWNQNQAMPPEQLKALTEYVESGHGFLPIHCASACYGGSPEFIKLVGGRFKSHTTGVFEPKTVNTQHPITADYQGFSAWDETYVHDNLGDGRTILQTRDEEPWTWVRQQGKGRVFYTASGHDHRVWDLPQFHELLKRAVFWAVGSDAYDQWKALNLPKLEMEPMKLPGYLKRELIPQGQKPLKPEDSIKMAQIPVGFEISLFASEPDIVNPINVAWDHKGRAFVLETVDYPNNLHDDKMGNDKITICEDTDGDGRADKFKVFADKLSIPTSLCFVGTRLLCTNASEILLLEDTDGDDKADVRKSIIEGFGIGDTHAGVSNMRLGLDNWVYATVGYSGFRGTVGEKNISFSSGLFRFLADGSKLEYLQSTTNNTWGLGFTSNFDILGSTANGNPSWVYTFPKERYESLGMNQPKTPRADDNPLFNPSSNDIRQVDQFERYTAGAGHSFYTSTRFPEEYREKYAFVTEGTGKLVGQFVVEPKGASYQSKQLYNNLYSSADAWSGPVAAETGPDGAVWISDWYNLIIQHNPTPNKQNSGLDAKNGKGNAYETPVRDTQHGRVYRIYPSGTRDDKNPGLDLAKQDALIAALSHPNLFWRMSAQSLLIQRAKNDVVPALKELVKKSEAASSHAFAVLASLRALDDASIATALRSSNRALRRIAIDHAGKSAPAVLLVSAKGPDLGTKSTRELAEKLVALSYGEPSEELAKSLYTMVTDASKEWFSDAVLTDAWQIAARRNAAAIIALADAREGKKPAKILPSNLIPNADFSESGSGIPKGWSLHMYGGDRSSVKMSMSDQGRNQSKALQITATESVDAGAGIELQLEPDTNYRFSAWVRTQNVKRTGGLGAMINVHGAQEKSKGMDGTKDWQLLSFDFKTDGDGRELLHCLLGGYGGSTGTAWFDDLSLTKLGGGGSPQSAVDGLRSWYASSKKPANLAEKKNKVDPEVVKRGAETYALICTACHQPDGQGTPGAFPPLDGSDWLVNDPELPIKIVLKGLQGPVTVKGVKYTSVMPPHNTLDDQKIADVLSYARHTWSNDAPAISADQVKATREKVKAQIQPWTAKDLGKE
jgi:putative membrane-bound dehydrogenase-like protein